MTGSIVSRSNWINVILRHQLRTEAFGHYRRVFRTRVTPVYDATSRRYATRDPRNVHIIPSHKSRCINIGMHFSSRVSLLDVVYGGIGETREREREIPMSLGWRSGIRKNMDRGDARRVTRTARKYARRRTETTNVERCGRYIRVSQPLSGRRRGVSETRWRILKVPRQYANHFSTTLPCFTSRSYRYSCVADVVYRRDNRNLVNRESCSRKATI